METKKRDDEKMNEGKSEFITDLEEKMDEILGRLAELERRIALIEENTAQIVEESRSRIRLRPRSGQPIVPSIYRQTYPDATTSRYPTYDVGVDVTSIVNESLAIVLETLVELGGEKREVTTAEIAKNLKLSRSTISGRLNMLHRLGLVERKRGRLAKYKISEEGQKFLNK